MRAFTVLIVVCLVAYSSAQKIDVPLEGVNITPKAKSTENHYELVACENCKIVLTCTFQVKRCRKSSIMIKEGDGFTKYCPEKYPIVHVSSESNVMRFDILQEGKVGATCQAKSTKPYIGLPAKRIDSSEHGLARKRFQQPSCRCGWTNKSPGRIVVCRQTGFSRIIGGKQTGINEYPFAVLMMLAKNGYAFCGGSIITPFHILTAAHCTDPFKNRKLIVRVGEHDIRLMSETNHTRELHVKRVHQHEGYDDDGGDNLHDIAILELATKIEFNDFVGPICIPRQQKNYLDEYIKVMGWGLTKDASEKGKASPFLRKVNLKVIDPEICSVIYGTNTTEPTQICTYNNKKDSCQGDSGGPLVRHHPATNMYEQVALVSYGTKCASTDPGVNTDVAAYLPWILSKINTTKLCFTTGEEELNSK